MIRLDMDENIAVAIKSLVESNPQSWALIEHFIALKIIRVRDQLEITSSDKLGGYAQGLRFLFELYPRAIAKLDGETFQRNKEISGEDEFIVDPLSD